MVTNALLAARPCYCLAMTGQRAEIEAFVRHIVAEVEAAEADGIVEPGAIAERFNAMGLTTRKGRTWNRATMAKFLSSPGAKRFRSRSEKP